MVLVGKDLVAASATPLVLGILAEGRVVARLTDLGWGGRLRELFASDAEGDPVDAEVPAELGRAVLRVLAGWGWAQRPVAVAWVPSLGRPRLVESLATGIASAGRRRASGTVRQRAGSRPRARV